MVKTFLVRSEEPAQVPMEGGEDRFVPPPTSYETTSTMMFAAGDNRQDVRILTGAIRVHGRRRSSVIARGDGRAVAALEFFEHHLRSTGHENLLPYDPHYVNRS
jgi:hypothetical protein